MTIKPFGRQILVKPVEQENAIRADSGVYCEYGKVIAVGDDVKHVKVGDTIGYTPWGMNHLEIDGVRHYFIIEAVDFILGTIEYGVE